MRVMGQEAARRSLLCYPLCDPMNDPLPPTDPKPAPMSVLPQPKDITEVDDPVIGLAFQFVIGVMLAQGITEVTVRRELLAQAQDQLFTARQTEDGGFVVRLLK